MNPAIVSMAGSRCVAHLYGHLSRQQSECMKYKTGVRHGSVIEMKIRLRKVRIESLKQFHGKKTI